MKKIIIYFEDEEDFREVARIDLEEKLPNYRIITQEGGHKYGNAAGCINEVFKQIENLRLIAMVCTDGNLAGDVAGWDIVEELRHRGYDGPALYIGGTLLPKEKAHLYVDRADKTGEGLISVIKRHIKNE